MNAVVVELTCADIVGESLVYDERRDALVWVDILGRRIHRLALGSRHHETWATPDFPTSIGLRQDGGAIVGLTSQVVLWDFGGEFRPLAVPEPDLPDNRLNEGQVAPDGSFWVGSMQNNFDADGNPTTMTRNSGAVYRIGLDGAVTQLTPNVFGIANTMAWTDDGRFLIADSIMNTIFAYAISGERLGERAVYFGPYGRGVPDGSTMDARGRLWNCRVTGSAVAAIATDGTIETIVDMPCSWPTSCAFGGANFDRLYVTSARFTMSAEHLAAHPEEGSLFSADVGAIGRAPHRFG